MAKVLNDEMLKQILEELAGSAYFYQKEKGKARDEEKHLYEEDGSIIATFTSGIAQVEPGEEDLLGKIWNPPLKDKDGNPYLTKAGTPRKAWDKFEVKAIVGGKEVIYGLGGNNSGSLRGVLMEMTKNSLKSIDLPGTKWKLKFLGNFKWDVAYLGKVELPKETKKANGKKVEAVPVKDKIMQAVLTVKEKSPFSQKLSGIGKGDFINAVAFFAEVDEKKVNTIWQEVLNAGIIREEGDKIFFV